MSARSLTTPSPRHSTQRLAWGILSVSFALFCVVCLITGLGVQYFLFQSTMPLPAVVIVGRGTVGLTGADAIEQVVRRDRELFGSATLSTDAQSQATVSVLDPQRQNQLVLSVVVNAGSQVSVRSLVRPRFEWSGDPYNLVLEGVNGLAELFVPQGLNRPVRVRVNTVGDAWVVISRPGGYRVRVSEADVKVDNIGGEVALVSPMGRSQSIPVGQRGVLTFAAMSFVVSPSYADLLDNSDFQQINTAASSDGATREFPRAWACTDSPNDAPSGVYALTRDEGRVALALRRGDGANSHGETGCAQYFGPPGEGGREVTAFDYLSLRATFRIFDQSLPLCGIEGSECPFMLEIAFIDRAGVLQRWYHGFYVRSDPQLLYPVRCASCVGEHENVNPGAWYRYESENLFSLFTEDERPVAIESVRFYASGHQYDVVVSDVSLYAGNMAVDPGQALGG